MSQHRFTGDHVTDAKRFVRYESYLLARSLLRAHRGTHFTKPRILILAGGTPSGEIECIRSLWSDAHITAIDRVKVSVDAARTAGADRAVVRDIYKSSDQLVAQNLRLGQGKTFDVVCLDFCGLVDDEKRSCLRSLSQRALSSGGIAIMTFSYGHDVAEKFITIARGGKFEGELTSASRAMMERGMPEAVIGRLKYMTTASLSMMNVFLYRGAQTPMCNVVWQKKPSRGKWPQDLSNDERISFDRVEEDLVEAAIVHHTHIAKIYAMPDERVRELRRREAARKAVATRTRKPRSAESAIAAAAVPATSEEAISLRMRVEAAEREMTRLAEESQRLSSFLKSSEAKSPRPKALSREDCVRRIIAMNPGTDSEEGGKSLFASHFLGDLHYNLLAETGDITEGDWIYQLHVLWPRDDLEPSISNLKLLDERDFGVVFNSAHLDAWDGPCCYDVDAWRIEPWSMTIIVYLFAGGDDTVDDAIAMAIELSDLDEWSVEIVTFDLDGVCRWRTHKDGEPSIVTWHVSEPCPIELPRDRTTRSEYRTPIDAYDAFVREMRIAVLRGEYDDDKELIEVVSSG